MNSILPVPTMHCWTLPRLSARHRSLNTISVRSHRAALISKWYSVIKYRKLLSRRQPSNNILQKGEEYIFDEGDNPGSAKWQHFVSAPCKIDQIAGRRI